MQLVYNKLFVARVSRRGGIGGRALILICYALMQNQRNTQRRESRSERLDKVNVTVNNKNLIAIIQYVPEGTISPMGKVTTFIFLPFSLYCLFTSILCLVGTRANDRPQFLGD